MVGQRFCLLLHRTVASRIKSCSIQPARALTLASFSQEQFCHMSQSLYKLGELRYLTGETLANCYRHFMDTGLNNVQATNNLCCLATSQPVKEFIDISALIAEFGTPEVADQMSDATSASATSDAVEERCVQCLRLAENDIPQFSANDINLCLQSIAWWPSEATRSLAARELLRSLDATCQDKLNSQQLTVEEQFRLAYLWQSLVCQPSGIKYPEKLLSFMSSYILQSPLTSLVSYLLILASVEEPISQKPKCSEFCEKLKPAFKILSESELLAACMGLRGLEDCDERNAMYRYLEQRISSSE